MRVNPEALEARELRIRKINSERRLIRRAVRGVRRDSRKVVR